MKRPRELPPIAISPLGADLFLVRVGARTRHRVRASAAVLDRLRTEGETDPEVIQRAFKFLLEREPPEAILSAFAIEDVARYFPSFWTAMGASLPPRAAEGGAV